MILTQTGQEAYSLITSQCPDVILLDFDKHRVYNDDVDAGLTQNEFKLVSLLGKYSGKVLTYDFMMKEIWGPNMQNDNRILRVNMANIRRKIEKNPAQPNFFLRRLVLDTG